MSFPRIPGFTIHSLLGEGGMGSVYRATEVATGREVALKILRRSLVTDEEYILRFKREAQALAAVEHPAIARFYATGSDGDILYLAMEIVEGEPLSERIADGPLPAREALEMTAQVAEGLAAAHRAGLIHRDVKPSNIILAPTGSADAPFAAKLTDFGLARRVEGSGLTTSGRVVGSLPYMSPEQIRGENLSPASDIYSLGVVLYETLSGKLPFDAPEESALATRILTQPAPMLPPGLPGVPISLNVLLVRMLAKDPSLRPQSAAEVAARLEALRDGKAPTAVASEAEAHAGLPARLLAALCRVSIRVAPAGKPSDRFAGSTNAFARRLVRGDARENALLDATLARRAIRAARGEVAILERKRDDRLYKATYAETSVKTASGDERGRLERLARDMHGEAEIFDKRIQTLSTAIARDTERARALEERARA